MQFWIYFEDADGGWYPAVALVFTELTRAERIIDALRAEFPSVQFRIETDDGARR